MKSHFSIFNCVVFDFTEDLEQTFRLSLDYAGVTLTLLTTLLTDKVVIDLQGSHCDQYVGRHRLE